MRFNRELIAALLPTGEGLPNFGGQLFDDVNLSRSYAWTSYVRDRLDNGFPFRTPVYEYARRYRGRAIDLSIGFISLNSEQAEGGSRFRVIDDFVFGIQLLVKGDENRPYQIMPSGIQDIPLVIKFGNSEYHSLPSLTGGTTACWVKSNNAGSKWNYGVLTCGHVVGNTPLHSVIPLCYPGSATYIHGRLADVGYNCIDAAIIAINPIDWPGDVTLCKAIHPPAAGMAIDLHLPSGIVAGTVLHLSTHAHYFGPQIGHRLYIDCVGQHTDSGSFVEHNGGALGMYMGTIPGGNGTREGFCQSLVQVESFFQLDMYR
jgi:hypothetical protein